MYQRNICSVNSCTFVNGIKTRVHRFCGWWNIYGSWYTFVRLWVKDRCETGLQRFDIFGGLISSELEFHLHSEMIRWLKHRPNELLLIFMWILLLFYYLTTNPHKNIRRLLWFRQADLFSAGLDTYDKIKYGSVSSSMSWLSTALHDCLNTCRPTHAQSLHHTHTRTHTSVTSSIRTV